MKRFNSCYITSGLVIQFILVYAIVGFFTSRSIWRLSIPLASVGITLVYPLLIKNKVTYKKSKCYKNTIDK